MQATHGRKSARRERSASLFIVSPSRCRHPTGNVPWQHAAFHPAVPRDLVLYQAELPKFRSVGSAGPSHTCSPVGLPARKVRNGQVSVERERGGVVASFRDYLGKQKVVQVVSDALARRPILPIARDCA